MEGEQEDHRDGPDGDGVNLDAVRCDGVLHVVDIDALTRQVVSAGVILLGHIPHLFHKGEGLVALAGEPGGDDHAGVFVGVELAELVFWNISLWDGFAGVFHIREHRGYLWQVFEPVVELLLIGSIPSWHHQGESGGLAKQILNSFPIHGNLGIRAGHTGGAVHIRDLVLCQKAGDQQYRNPNGDQPLYPIGAFGQFFKGGHKGAVCSLVNPLVTADGHAGHKHQGGEQGNGDALG